MEPRSSLRKRFVSLVSVMAVTVAGLAITVVAAPAAAPDGSRIYIAGDFTTVNGQPAGKVAALNPTNGALLSTFKINIATRVKTIAATNSTVYVGGLFTAANGQPRNRLAAMVFTRVAML